MEKWLLDLLEEYKELKSRRDNLQLFIADMVAGRKDNTSHSSVLTYKHQLIAMNNYLSILRKRLKAEEIEV